MAHYSVVQLKSPMSKDTLLANGYINIASCSRQSVWYLTGYHELYIEPEEEIPDTASLLDLVFRQGWNDGKLVERQKLKDSFLRDAAKQFDSL